MPPWFSRHHLGSRQRLSELVKVIRDDKSRNSEQLPSLARLLNEYASDDIKTLPKQDLIRRLIRVFKGSTTEASYSEVLKNYSIEEQQLINRFVVDEKPASDVGKDFHVGLSPSARQELENLDSQPDGFISEGELSPKYRSPAGELVDHIVHEVKAVANVVHSRVHPHPEFAVYDDPGNKHKVPAYFDKEFQDWGRTVKNVPRITYVQTNSYGIQQIVRYAKNFVMNVRASRYRHFWSPIFSIKGQILISTLDLYKATALPNFESLPDSKVGECPTDLNAITFQETP